MEDSPISLCMFDLEAILYHGRRFRDAYALSASIPRQVCGSNHKIAVFRIVCIYAR